MSYKQLTLGTITQEFDDEGNCLGQSFKAQEEVMDIEYEDEDGEFITEPANHKGFPFNMVQPSDTTSQPRV